VFLDQFRKSGIELQRINAIDRLGAGRQNYVTNEVAACWLSHQAAYSEFLKSTASHAIIMEDDALLNPGTLKFLKNLQQIDLKQIDIFQFGYLTHNFKIDFPTYDPFPMGLLKLRNYVGYRLSSFDSLHRNWLKITRFVIRKALPIFYKFTELTGMKIRQRSSEKFYQTEFEVRKKYALKNPIIYHSIEAGSHAYLISRNCAEKLLSFNNPVFLPADLALMSIGRSKNFVVVRTSKSLCAQNKSESSIPVRSLSREGRNQR
jgi:GR25 family glycosyltransferase involved in LPS biosynthesis